jgi:hypothetical protein
MPFLEVCRRRLKDGILPTDPALKAAFSEVRDNTGAACVFYSAIEEPQAFFAFGMWPSMEAYNAFESSPDAHVHLKPVDDLSTEEWVEHIPLDALQTLPIDAPVMTVSRCFFKEYDNHPQRYYDDVQALVRAIEENTKPWRYIGSWTVDTTADSHKWIVFGGYRSKKHHQEIATKLKSSNAMFTTIPEHYDEGTVHRHCWNMEKEVKPEMLEVLEGWVPQVITKGSRP